MELQIRHLRLGPVSASAGGSIIRLPALQKDICLQFGNRKDRISGAVQRWSGELYKKIPTSGEGHPGSLTIQALTIVPMNRVPLTEG